MVELSADAVEDLKLLRVTTISHHGSWESEAFRRAARFSGNQTEAAVHAELEAFRKGLFRENS